MAVAPACYGLYTIPFKDLVNELGWGWGYFVDFVAKHIKEFCLKIGCHGCNNTVVFCTFQIYNIKTTPLAPSSVVRKFGWEVKSSWKHVILLRRGHICNQCDVWSLLPSLLYLLPFLWFLVSWGPNPHVQYISISSLLYGIISIHIGTYVLIDIGTCWEEIKRFIVVRFYKNSFRTFYHYT